MTEFRKRQMRPFADQSAKWQWPEKPGRWRLPLLLLIVVTSYGAGAWIALRLTEASGLQGVLFIPAGVMVAFLLRLSRRLWWIVLLGAGISEFVMNLGDGLTVAQALGFTTASLVEPVVGASIVIFTCGAVDLARRRHVLWYTLGAVLVGPASGAALGAGAGRILLGDDFVMAFVQWWLGDTLGVILVGSAILAWGSSPDRRPLFSSSGGGLIAGSIVVTMGVLTLSDLPLVFSVLVGVVLAGALFGVRAVTATSLTVALTTALLMILDPEDSIVGLTRASAFVLIQLQVGVFSLAGLLVAAESHERELATRRAAKAGLEAEEADRGRRRVHDLSVHIQRGLLPTRLLQPPGIQIAARYEAASEAFEVGGDWYDTIDLGEGRIGLVVGDIVGHGIEAMTSMGRLRTAFAALAMHHDDPADLLSEVDGFVGGPDGAGYATVFYAIFDARRGTIEYSSAGHPPGLLVSPGGQTSWLDQGQSEPLFGQPSLSRQRGSAILEPGGILVLYSDGLIERRGESLDVGLSRLERLVTEMAERRPEGICDELFSRFGIDASRADDAVVLVIKSVLDHHEIYRETFPARPEELRRIRSSIRSWASSRDLPPSTRDDLLIAIGEATANSVRHAYKNSKPGEVEIMITPVGGILEVAVKDRGTWQAPSGPSGYPGMGRLIIRSLTQEFRTESNESGTQVTFRLPVASKLL
jgi:serine phosphatase RsbU (regulator of sigma subunit)/anti-sigma regulatory factor (Ser/Thr protein kinase)